MKTEPVRRAALAAAACLLTTLSAPGTRAPVAGMVLDGVRDDAYEVLARDPAGDLAPAISSPATNWADLTDLSVATDTTTLWVYVNLPIFSQTSAGEFGLAIDTDGAANSGATLDPWGNAITFAYTSTHNNVGEIPLSTSSVLLPDAVVRGAVFTASPDQVDPAGWTELDRWIGSSWTGQTVNWGGVSNGSIGTHIAFLYGHGIEMSIPFAELGVPPTTTLNLQFYATDRTAAVHFPGAWDTVPPDAQGQTQTEPTIERHFATLDPLALPSLPLVSFSAAAYTTTEAAGSAPITITVAPTSTRLISATLMTAGGTADVRDYFTISQTLVFAPGQTNQVVSLQVLTDAVPDGDKTVLISLRQPVHALLGQPNTSTLTIRDSLPVIVWLKLYLPLVRR